MEHVQPDNCIAPEALKQLIATLQLQVKIIDVRSRKEYDHCHIPGAIHIAISDLELVNRLFDKSDHLITACGKGGDRSEQAVEKLQEWGFKNAAWLCGGTIGWTENQTQII